MLSLDTGGEELGSASTWLPDFIDSPNKGLPPLRSEWGGSGTGESEGWEKKKEGKQELVHKMKNIHKKEKKFLLHNLTKRRTGK